MAQHIVATFTDPVIKVDLGIYGLSPEISALQYFNARHIVNVRKHPHLTDIVIVEMAQEFDGGKKQWPLIHDQSYAGAAAMIIDTVDGVAPTDQEDLCAKIAALMR